VYKALKFTIDILNRNIPGNIIIDDAEIITSIGPLVVRLFSESCVGKPLTEAFSIETMTGKLVTNFTAHSEPLSFRHRASGMCLTGYVWIFDGGAILAVGLSTEFNAFQDFDVSLADFAKTPLSTAGYLRSNLAKILKEEARDISRAEKKQRALATAVLSDIKLITAVICHDVLNYHSVITRSLRLISGSTDCDAVRNLSDQSKDACERASMLLQASMHLSEHQRETASTFSVDETILELEGIMRALLFEGSDLKLSLAAPNTFVTAVRSGFVSSLLNLVKNSTESMLRTGGSIILSSRVIVSRNPEVVITVSDTGSNSAGSQLNLADGKIHSSTKHEGVGLGLESVRRFCKSSGWVIRTTPSHPNGLTVEMLAQATISLDDRPLLSGPVVMPLQ